MAGGKQRGSQAAGGRRVFVALDLPDDVRRALAGLAQMLPLPRRVEAEALHLTLAFLGTLDDPALDEIHMALEVVHAAAFELSLEGAGLFGGARPRVAWAGVSPCPGLEALQARVESAARRAGATVERRRFHPHVTLGRFPPGLADAPRLEQALADMAGFRAGPWNVEEFVLYQSQLHPDGARYTPLARYPLEG